ncbi:Uncharacterized protein Rs2_36095 [Raphanus sativus]|nr:Uncharacterized protein Rs2_36095 [Raphanus sativus]
MTGFIVFGFVGGCANIHSLASDMALRMVSSGEIDLFSKIRRFLDLHKVQMIHAESDPASIPTGGKDGIFLTLSHPSWKLLKVLELKMVAVGANSHTLRAKGHWNIKWFTDSNWSHLAHRESTGIFLIANCSPTGKAPCRDFQTFIF